MLWTGEEMWIYTGDSDIWSFRLPENKETTCTWCWPSIVWTKKTWFAAFGVRKTYRYGFVAVWASAHREMYVHGGVNHSTVVFGDLWKYSDNSKLWEQINFDGGPQARTYHVGVWREEKEELFIQGGTGDGEIFSDLWKYSVPDNTWTLLSQSAPARASSVGVWLPKTQEIWLHGGYCLPDGSLQIIVDCTYVWKFALMDNCGAFSCAAGTVRKDHAEDIGSFGQSECCNNITATTTSTYTTATTTFVTITTSMVSRTTVTGTTMTGTSTVTSTATEQWEEANAANALGGKELRLELIAAVVQTIDKIIEIPLVQTVEKVVEVPMVGQTSQGTTREVDIPLAPRREEHPEQIVQQVIMGEDHPLQVVAAQAASIAQPGTSVAKLGRLLPPPQPLLLQSRNLCRPACEWGHFSEIGAKWWLDETRGVASPHFLAHLARVWMVSSLIFILELILILQLGLCKAEAA
eukprot:symbB.v1.2.006168.t1/scaffold367.1/size382069/1